MEHAITVRGLVNQFGRQVVHDHLARDAAHRDAEDVRQAHLRVAENRHVGNAVDQLAIDSNTTDHDRSQIPRLERSCRNSSRAASSALCKKLSTISDDIAKPMPQIFRLFTPEN